MSKLKRSMFNVALCLLLVVGAVFGINFGNKTVSASAAVADAYTQSGNRIENEYLQFQTNGDGFSFHTTGGDPNNANDNYQRLLYGEMEYSTSATVLNINGVTQNYSYSQSYKNADGTSLYSANTYNGVKVEQIISFTYNTQTSRYDTVELKYIMTNVGNEYKTAGARIYFDTMLGNNDHAPFRVPYDLTREREYVGDEIPQTWQAFDSLSNPTVVGSGTFYTDISERPDKVQFILWSSCRNEYWDNAVSNSSFGDSAVNMYYNPVNLAPGESRMVRTFYGVSEFTAVPDDAELALQAVAPSELEADLNTNTYVGNPFSFNSWLTNRGGAAANNVTATLVLPNGLTAEGQDLTVNVGTLAAYASVNMPWTITADVMPVDTTHTYSIVVTADDMDTVTYDFTLFVPGVHIHEVEVIGAREASCTVDGYTHYQCATCGDDWYDILPALGHDLVYVESHYPSCTEAGYEVYDCARCGERITDPVPAPGHAWNPVATYYEPTCTENGYWEVTCDNCAAVEYIENRDSKLGHEYDDGTTIVMATCTESGVVRYSCIHDGCDEYYDVLVEADHSAYVYEEYRVDADCWNDGYIHYACSACGHTYEEVIESQGHAYSYSDNGNGTHYVYCNGCGENFYEEHQDDRRVCVCGYRNSAYISVLLIQDHDPWATDSNEDVLGKLLTQGKIDAWEKKSTSQILNGNVDFNNYSLILFANDQGQAMYNNYARFADDLETYVENGGALVFGACDSGWMTGTINVPLPGGAETAVKYDHNNYIVDTTSPVVTGEYTDGTSLLESQLYGNWCSHNYFTSVPANANVIFKNGDGNATLIEYTLGNGYVLASGLTWEFYVYRTSYIAVDFADVAYDDLIMTALSKIGAYDYQKYLVEFVDYDGALINAQRIERGHSPAQPAAPVREGHTFIGWDMNNDGVVDYFDYQELPQVIAPVVYTAVYDVLDYTVTLADTEHGTVSGGGTFEYGTSILLTATPDEGYSVQGWYLDGELISTEDALVYVVTSDVELVCLFKQNVSAELELTLDKPHYNNGEKVTVTLTLKNITDPTGILGYKITGMRYNGMLFTEMVASGVVSGVEFYFPRGRTGWYVYPPTGLYPTRFNVLGDGANARPAFADGEIVVVLSFYLDVTALNVSLPCDVVCDFTGVGINGNNEECTIRFNTVEATIACGHSNTITEGYAEPTCTAEGFSGRILCAECGELVDAGHVLPMIAHSWIFSERLEPTCESQGCEYEICTACNEIRVSLIIDALGHLETTVPGYAENCVNPGLTDGIYCTRCGQFTVPQETIPARGHNIIHYEGYPATCTTEGLTNGEYCDVCNVWVIPQEVIPATGHNTEVVYGYEATCTEDGLTDGEYCNNCNTWLVEQVVIAALGHNEQVVYGYEATCTESGLTDGVICERCGEWLVAQEEIAALGHDVEVVLGHEATCTEDGLTDGEYCNRCNIWTVEQFVIEANGHNTVIVDGYDATCTEDGLTAGEYCEICGTWVVEQVVIPASHAASEWQPLEYDQFGRVVKEEVVCTVCGLQLDFRIPAPEHSGEVIVDGYDATCEADGLTAGVYCEDCGIWVIPQEIIPGGEHIESDWTPVYDENGNVKHEEKVCERCGLQLDLRIPAENNGGNGYGNGGGIDIYDNQMNVDNLNVSVGCAGVIGMAGILPSAAFVGGMLLLRRRKSQIGEDSSEE